jgi:hypothetical protein
MNFFETVTDIVHSVLVFAGAMALFAFLGLWAIARLPSDNPLRRILYLLSVRVGVSAGAAVAAIPATSIPGLGEAYDIAVPCALVWFWITLIRQVAAILRDSRGPVARAHSDPPASPDADDRPLLPRRDDHESPRLPR